MSFLQPWLLLGLPLLLLPIIIHLINQWRYQTKKWGAMMFLLAANRMARGYAKVRQYLILAARMLAIAGLIFAISRPLASGLLGFSAGKADTTIVLLDRSPSMQERSVGGAETKLETARRQLRQSLTTIGSNRWVLIDGATNEPQEFDSVPGMFDSPSALSATATSDLPSMLQATLEYLQKNQPGQTEVWICSDLREADWNATSGQWSVIRDAISKLPLTVRFHLLAYPEKTAENLAIRVSQVHRESIDGSNDLVLSMMLSRDEGWKDARTIPIQIEVNGARSELAVELTGSTLEVKDHRVAMDQSMARGWGKVSIPSDSNNSDNDYYFVFDLPPPRRTIVIGEDDEAVKPLELAASISPDPNRKAFVDRFSPDQFQLVNWDEAGLLLWQGRLPTGTMAETIQTFLKRGGCVLFFPPTPTEDGAIPDLGPSSNSFAGVRWEGWKASEKVMVENWRGDQDLLAATRSGASLPVGQIELKGHAALAGEWINLASLSGGDPLLAKAPSDERGGIYFFTASTAPKFSNLARGGVVLYVAIQRALDKGLESLGNTRELIASQENRSSSEPWTRVAGPDEALSTEYGIHGGVYQSSDQWIAVNRAFQEDQPGTLDDEQLGELFRGLDLHRVESKAGSTSSIVREIWRIFLVAMILAMIGEAAMCLPKVIKPREAFA